MDTWSLIRACRALGVKLAVTKDDELICEPASSLTPELREAISAVREDLLYDVLLSEAHRYVLVETCPESDAGAVLDAHAPALDAAYLARDWPAFRSAVRSYARAGLLACRAARRALPAASLDSATPVMEGVSA